MQTPEVSVTVDIPAAVQVVWDDVANVASHAEWMADAHAIDFESEQREGVGTRIRVETRVGPLRTTDRMTFTAWEPPHRMAVDHRGLFKGEGEFLLTAAGPDSTRFTWRERVEFPWFLGGPLGAFVARPILGAIWRRNLKRLATRF